MTAYIVDAVGGVTAAALVAPFVALVDKCIIANASGREPLNIGLKKGIKDLFGNPMKFISQKYVHYVQGVYTGTYLVANFTETYCNKN